MKIFTLAKKNGIIFSSLLMLILVLANLGFIIFNNQVLDKSKQLKIEVDKIKSYNESIWIELVRNVDIGVRGYAVTGDTALLVPYRLAITERDKYIKGLEEMLKKQSYPALSGLDTVSLEVKKYAEAGAYLNSLTAQNLTDSLKKEIKKDRGLDLWKVYNKWSKGLYAFEDGLNAKAEAEYSAAINRTIWVQILLVIIGLPSLIFTIVRIMQDEKKRKKLFLELEQNNRKYLFDPGTPIEINNESELITSSIVNFQKAATFINQISQGDYKVDWAELNERNEKYNKTNLAGELVQMREKMKKFKEEDEKRLWATEGIAQFSEIIRSDQNNVKELGDKLIAFVVKYLGAQIGSLFLLQEENNEKFLQLVACFAFDKKKFLEKRIEVGEGLVGQTFLEKLPNMYTKIPQNYITITSGLGEANPSCLLIVPMKYNQKVEAVIEVASFKKFESYQLEWLEKIGEITASTIVSVKTAEKTNVLLEQFKEQTEQMRAQEEELRQNLEELEATQEEMRRKEIELENRHQQLEEMISKNQK